ncbi:GGDEF domain-containing protein [Aliikangiella marina]|uniref:diguanylate cyclase n=1 Tax=Aliikangiella marina TaxID=1712262 RepID=A0A545TJK7_9GAMM|nr:GGDEF domain-containing protein [Aliikangiella marina]TQV77410.1 GGDEF domain-containing protein [Aliikangiella marina]
MGDLGENTDLVSQIAGFTSLRDVDLLELSLLKSIYAIVNPIQVSLLALDNQNIILKQVDYSSLKHGTITSKVKASKELLSACELLDSMPTDYYTVNLDNHALTLFLLSHTRKVAQYITIESNSFGVSKSNSQQIMGMLRIYRNFKQLLLESQTDELTGLSNRKAFDEVIKKIHDSVLPTPEKFDNEKRQEASDNALWLAMVDIDHFKKINDQHGHLMGDEVLMRIAQTIRASLRENDMLFRYGGEEFTLIFSAADSDEASSILHRSMNAVRNINIAQVGKISVSIGVVKMERNVFHMTLVEHADKALYKSKDDGRDRVTFFNSDDFTKTDAATNSDCELF